ncbi:MAG: xylulokinase, partial [Phycisphaerales bacterium]
VGNAPLTGFTLPKLLWVREHEPQAWSRVRRVMLPKDFVAFMLTGLHATDVGDASGTLLFDVAARCWSAPALRAVGIDPALLPPAHESTAVVGHVSPAAAGACGLPAGTPVVIGTGDNMAGAVGAGVVVPGSLLAALGTSGVVYAHSAEPLCDLADPLHPGRLHTMCAGSPGAWCLTGCMLSAGGALHWARSVLAPETPFGALLEEAASAPPGCDGLAFLPYLTGERCPHPDPQARGGWIGLTSRHTRAHLLRAVVEGVTFGMGEIVDLARAVGVPVRSVRVTGGGNRSPFWRGLQADVYRAPIESTDTDAAGCALGAALLAGVGAGRWASVQQACQEAVRVTAVVEPSGPPLTAARSRFAALYRDLAHRFADMV